MLLLFQDCLLVLGLHFFLYMWTSKLSDSKHLCLPFIFLLIFILLLSCSKSGCFLLVLCNMFTSTWINSLWENYMNKLHLSKLGKKKPFYLISRKIYLFMNTKCPWDEHLFNCILLGKLSLFFETISESHGKKFPSAWVWWDYITVVFLLNFIF